MPPLFSIPLMGAQTRFDYEIWSFLSRRWLRVLTSITTRDAADITTINTRRSLVQGTDYRFTAV